MTPYQVKDQTSQERIPVPCGKCPPCKKRRASGWSFRLEKQGDVSTSALFITLTYDTKHAAELLTRNNFLSLKKTDIQEFMKRLRINQERSGITEKIKYFFVGEYGGKTFRPHYHAIIFNAEIKHIEGAWQKGEIHYGTVNGASIGYTLKYMSKPGKIPMHKNDDRLKEFALMSKGLGVHYLTEKIKLWHKADLENRMYVPLQDNKKASMPRYFKLKLYSDQERQQISQAMAKLSDQEVQDLVEKLGTNFLENKKDLITAAYERMWKKSTKNDSI